MSGAPLKHLTTDAPLSATIDKRILYIVNDYSFILSHRLPLLRGAAKAGFEVIVAAPLQGAALEKGEGEFKLVSFPLSRWGINPVQEFKTIRALRAVIDIVRPDIIHNITIKPVLYGTLIGTLLFDAKVINTLPGLGHVFSTTGVLAAIRRSIVMLLYRFLLRRASATITQNRSDAEFLKSACLLHNVRLIRGSGVTFEEFEVAPIPHGIPTVLLPARLLKTKGISTFVEAARLILSMAPQSARFVIAGEAPANHPDCVSPRELNEWRKEGCVTFLGFVPTIADLMQESSIICLPSAYGEGFPKVLLEGAACGRALVATDLPGCRELIKDKETGLLVPPNNPKALAEALLSLINNRDACARLGEAARRFVVSEQLSASSIAEETIQIYQEALSPIANT